MAIVLSAFSALVVNAEESKAPAQQVPVESLDGADAASQGEGDLEEPATDAAGPTAEDDGAAEQPRDAASAAANEEAASKPKAESGASAKESKPETDTSDPGEAQPAAERERAGSGASFSDDPPVPDREAGGSESTANDAAGFPGLPRRKPPKPIVRKADRDKKGRRPNPALKRSDRDKYLCKVLQACRNDFVRCKSKIKHPDQSPEWSAEKEACGAVYKDCVHKDFQGGEWFFTRWFYFEELDCR